MASAIVCNVRCCRSNERLAVLVEKRSLRGIRGREEPRENGGQPAYVSVKAVGSKRNMMRAAKIGWRGTSGGYASRLDRGPGMFSVIAALLVEALTL
jgi:hypothetical protein